VLRDDGVVSGALKHRLGIVRDLDTRILLARLCQTRLAGIGDLYDATPLLRLWVARMIRPPRAKSNDADPNDLQATP
jgi:hypothetical protein